MGTGTSGGKGCGKGKVGGGKDCGTLLETCRLGDCGWNAQGQLVMFWKKGQTVSMSAPKHQWQKAEAETLMSHGGGPPENPKGKIWRWDRTEWMMVPRAPLIRMRQPKAFAGKEEAQEAARVMKN